jgi:hypothetical protein
VQSPAAVALVQAVHPLKPPFSGKGIALPVIIIEPYPNARLIMHRDPEITRKILLAIDARTDSRPQELVIDGIEKEPFLRHIEYLFDDGMLEVATGKLLYSSQGGPYGHLPINVLIRDLTPSGHDLLGIMKNDSVWEKIKSSFTPAELAGMSFAIIRTIGTKLLEKAAIDKIAHFL